MELVASDRGTQRSHAADVMRNPLWSLNAMALNPFSNRILFIFSTLWFKK